MINLAYDDRGSGDPVLFIAGRGGAGRTWHLHQVPAFQRAGYRVITFDNRGIGATENAGGLTTETMVGDTAELIEQLIGGPRAGRGRVDGVFHRPGADAGPSGPGQPGGADGHPRARTTAPGHSSTGPNARCMDAGVIVPPEYDAKIRVLENFSPKTLNDDRAVADWLDMFTMWPIKATPGLRAQLEVGPADNRLPAYRAIRTPVLVIGFADDVLLPPHLGAEVADALPNGRYLEIPDAGHLGFIERPDAVNGAMLEFFAGARV